MSEPNEQSTATDQSGLKVAKSQEQAGKRSSSCSNICVASWVLSLRISFSSARMSWATHPIHGNVPPHPRGVRFDRNHRPS